MAMMPPSDPWPLTGDRYHRMLKPGGVVTRRLEWQPWTDGPGQWCIYGCPSQPSEFVDYGDVRILWANCQHPVDLTDGAHLRHAAAWPEKWARDNAEHCS